jgi:hypothetical protein
VAASNGLALRCLEKGARRRTALSFSLVAILSSLSRTTNRETASIEQKAKNERGLWT